MSRSSSSRNRSRGQTEPLVALAAVLAVSLGLSAYVVVLDGVADPSGPDAGPTLDRVHDRVTVGGVADPDRLADAVRGSRSDGSHVNATLTAADERWSAGGRPSDSSTADLDIAQRRLGVALSPGRVRPGTLRVRVWR